MDQSKSYNRPGGYSAYGTGTENVTVVDLLAQILAELEYHNAPARRSEEIRREADHMPELLERDQGRCRRCRRPVDMSNRRGPQAPSFLHVPEQDFGPNYVLLCRSCREFASGGADARREVIDSVGTRPLGAEAPARSASQQPSSLPAGGRYFVVIDKLSNSAVPLGEDEGLEVRSRRASVDEDSGLLKVRGRGVQRDLRADPPVDDHVPPVRQHSDDPALVDAPTDEVGGLLKRRGLEADNELKGGASGPEDFHEQRLPDRPRDTPETTQRLTHFIFLTAKDRPFLSRILCDLDANGTDLMVATSNWAHVTCPECQDIGADTVTTLNRMSDAALLSLGATDTRPTTGNEATR